MSYESPSFDCRVCQASITCNSILDSFWHTLFSSHGVVSLSVNADLNRLKEMQVHKFAEIEKLNAHILHPCFFSEAHLFMHFPPKWCLGQKLVWFHYHKSSTQTQTLGIFLVILRVYFNTQSNVIHRLCITNWLCEVWRYVYLIKFEWYF